MKLVNCPLYYIERKSFINLLFTYLDYIYNILYKYVYYIYYCILL